MNKLPVHVILAADRYGRIGYQNKLPWKLEGDLKRFKDRTMGQIIIVGRNTFESMPTLVGRAVIIVSQSLRNEANDEPVKMARLFERNVLGLVTTLESAIELANKSRESDIFREGSVAEIAHKATKIYVAGGAKLYEEAMKSADYLEYTLVLARKNTNYDTRIDGFNVKNWVTCGMPQRVEAVLVEGAAKVVSHIYFLARRISEPGSKNLLTRFEDPFTWMFDQCGQKWIDNAIDEDQDYTVSLGIDRACSEAMINHSAAANELITGMLEQAVDQLKHRKDEIPNLREWILQLSGKIETACYNLPPNNSSDNWLAEKIAKMSEESCDKDYFNMWTSGKAPALEGTSVTVKDGTIRSVTVAESSFGTPGLSGGIVVTEVGQAMNREALRNIGTQKEAAPKDVYQESLDRSAEHVGENLIANTRTRMTDAAVEQLLEKTKNEPTHPKWTVFHNRTVESGVVTMWRFYDDETKAQAEYDKHEAAGSGVTKRPYFHSHDSEYCPANWKELAGGTVHNPNGGSSPDKGH